MMKRDELFSNQFTWDYYPLYGFVQNLMQSIDQSPWGALLRETPLLYPYVEQQFKKYRDYPKPLFDLGVEEEITYQLPFCKLIHFKQFGDEKRQPLLLVAPLSGHHASLLRETVRTFLPDFRVYITDWEDARNVPVDSGAFSLATYVGYIRQFIELLGKQGDLNIVAVCQPTVPVMGAISLQAKHGGVLPKGTVLIGGPIDPRINPTQVNKFATSMNHEWFEQHTIHTVPFRYAGRGRRVYPGFLQYAAFVELDPNRHLDAERKYKENLYNAKFESDPIKRQEYLDNALKHQKFYNDYCAVMDTAAEYYLETIKVVFQEFQLPQGKWKVEGELVEPSFIESGMFLTIEGELDNIVGRGQTHAVHTLLVNVPKKNRLLYEAKGVGHYGVFSGKKWREIIYPIIKKALLTE